MNKAESTQEAFAILAELIQEADKKKITGRQALILDISQGRICEISYEMQNKNCIRNKKSVL